MVFVIGIFIGLVMGLTGAGGAILAVPLLMAVTALSLPQVAPTALVTVAAAAAFGAYLAWRKSFVRYRAAGLMALIGSCTAPLGLALAAVTPSNWLSLLFALILCFVALRLWQQALSAGKDDAMFTVLASEGAAHRKTPFCNLNDSTGRLIWTGSCTLCIAVTGAVTGFLSGLLGVGGGFFIVPALHNNTALSMHSAVGTSLMAIALTSVGVVLAALLKGQVIPLSLTAPMVCGALLGIGIGRAMAPRLAGTKLQLGFAALLVLVAVDMTARAAGYL